MNNGGVYSRIRNDKQIKKFCLYGFFKNLKFFEPYLIIYLINSGLDLFKIGILYSIREIIIYIFEIPSGIIADHFGKKNELMICFCFYILSFVFFFISSSFIILTIGMIFFGLGDAFRSGTHKAMIYGYLERENLFKYKTMVYGRTRSFSLIGSSLSALLSIPLVLFFPNIRWLFLVCILPYLMDFILISSYPSYLNKKNIDRIALKDFFKIGLTHFKRLMKNINLVKILFSSSLYDSIFKNIKDYIQPILKLVLISSVAVNIAGFEGDDQIKILSGIIYSIFYLVSSQASRYVHILTAYNSSGFFMRLFFDIMGFLSLILSAVIFFHVAPAIIIIFFALYILKDSRRPLFVDVCGDNMEKNERATILSIDSQLRSLFTIIFAPLFGLIADSFGLNILFLCIGIAMLSLNRFLRYQP